MLSKYLEKKIELISDDSSMNEGVSIELEYFLVESDINENDELDGDKVYGIEIVKRTQGMGVEKSYVRNVSSCRESTRSMLEKLINNTVTPVTLPFVLDDMLGA